MCYHAKNSEPRKMNVGNTFYPAQIDS